VKGGYASALVLCLLCLACGAGPSAGDAGSADSGLPHGAEGGMDTGAPFDAGPPLDTGGHDVGWVPPPDAQAARPLLCEEGGAPEPAGPCEVEDPNSTAGCDGHGGVVFDGRTCASATGGECSDPEGSFDSFEACAMACAAASECDRSKIIEWGSTCDTVWLHFRYLPVPDTACSLGNEWDCMEPPPPDAQPEYGTPGWRCWRKLVEVDPAFEEDACALTLMPSVSGLRCFNAL